MTEPNRVNYQPVATRGYVLACLGCGTLILDDDAAIGLHAGLHYLMNRWSTAAQAVLS